MSRRFPHRLTASQHPPLSWINRVNPVEGLIPAAFETGRDAVTKPRRSNITLRTGQDTHIRLRKVVGTYLSNFFAELSPRTKAASVILMLKSLYSAPRRSNAILPTFLAPSFANDAKVRHPPRLLSFSRLTSAQRVLTFTNAGTSARQAKRKRATGSPTILRSCS